MPNSDIRKFYNESMPKKFGDNYEYNRWFRTPLLHAGYRMTRDVIEEHIINDASINPSRVLELGPGAGTWTKMLLERFPKATLHLLDISREMLDRAKKALPYGRDITYTESDIQAWKPDGQYDLFFSSRVLEYVDDKQLMLEKIKNALAPAGVGFIITKMPHDERDRFFGRSKPEIHRGQISPVALKELLQRNGFIDVELYPVTMSVPVLHFGWLNMTFRKFFSGKALGPIGMLFSESYAVLFRKAHRTKA